LDENATYRVQDAGGQGIEVITARNNADEIRLLADYAARFALAGSVGF